MPSHVRGLLLLVLFTLAACGLPVPRTPPAAQAQTPEAGPARTWLAQGRWSARAPGLRMSGDCYLRGEGGRVHAALLDDSGLRLYEVVLGADALDERFVGAQLRELAPHLHAMLAAWLPHAGGRWHDGRYREAGRYGPRWYGGEPPRLRYLHADWPVRVGDYRELAGAALAHELVADGPLKVELRLELHEAALP